MKQSWESGRATRMLLQKRFKWERDIQEKEVTSMRNTSGFSIKSTESWHDNFQLVGKAQTFVWLGIKMLKSKSYEGRGKEEEGKGKVK